MSADIHAEGMASFASFLRTVQEAIEAQTPLRMSKTPIDAAATTKRPLLAKTFTLGYRTVNTGKYRETDMLRVAEALTVRFVFPVRPSDQFASLLEAAAVEEEVMRALQDQVAIGGIRCSYKGTDRAQSPGGEYLLIDQSYDIEHDWYSQPLTTTPA